MLPLAQTTYAGSNDSHLVELRAKREGLERSGARLPTQVGRALAELGIQSRAAHSPQAKGRIERLWGTLQNRLVAELRLAEASTMTEAEVVLQAFLPRFNQRFWVPPAEPAPAYRPLATGVDVEAVCCLAYTRTVAADNTISFGGRHLQLLSSPLRASYARLLVQVREHLDGGLSVSYQGTILAVESAPAGAPVRRARQGRRTAPQGKGTSKPSPTHPWRTYALTKSLST